ncbi:uncharacterized protein ISCGN_008644 [Ixodes scapularis]
MIAFRACLLVALAGSAFCHVLTPYGLTPVRGVLPFPPTFPRVFATGPVIPLGATPGVKVTKTTKTTTTKVDDDVGADGDAATGPDDVSKVTTTYKTPGVTAVHPFPAVGRFPFTRVTTFIAPGFPAFHPHPAVPAAAGPGVTKVHTDTKDTDPDVTSVESTPGDTTKVTEVKTATTPAVTAHRPVTTLTRFPVYFNRWGYGYTLRPFGFGFRPFGSYRFGPYGFGHGFALSPYGLNYGYGLDYTTILKKCTTIVDEIFRWRHLASSLL